MQTGIGTSPPMVWVRNSYVKYRKGDATIAIEFSGTYSMDSETALLRRQEIESAAAEILAGISPEAIYLFSKAAQNSCHFVIPDCLCPA